MDTPIFTPTKFDAVLFDMDGVLTATMAVHANAWKTMFDAFLEIDAEARGEAPIPFDINADYKLYVDGKPRLEGVKDFLANRAIQLPEGDPTEPPGKTTMWGLANWKNELVEQTIQAEGVEAFAGAVAFVEHLRRQGIRAGVVSSSTNCAAVLEAAKIAHLFETRVDGTVIGELGLPGKPAPDAFWEAASRLGVQPERTAVVEDAVAGVQAARAGRFALVIGVDDGASEAVLREHGADLVVRDLAELLPS